MRYVALDTVERNGRVRGDNDSEYATDENAYDDASDGVHDDRGMYGDDDA